MPRITNIHSHVFTGRCAPDYFFRMVLPSWADRWADEIKVFLEKRWMRRLIKFFASRRGNSQLLRYLQFIEVGTQSTQEEVFTSMYQAYTALGAETRFVALTLNMDHMDTQPSSHARIDDQLAEVERVRSHFPDSFLPFLGVDPRHKQGTDLLEWARLKIERRAFFGIKLYPSIGFFPFDPALDQLYDWAEQEQVPVMTHCTRSGTYYTGRMADVLPNLRPPTLNPAASQQMDSIYKRIGRFRDGAFTWKDSKYGCNVFLHPENYEPVLHKYPDLKLCFAHFGGDDEMLPADFKQPLRENGIDPTNWHDEIKRIMGLMDAAGRPMYENVYTDISYTLSNKNVYPILNSLMRTPLAGRILFGTDFFMTVREKGETELLQQCTANLDNGHFQRMAVANNINFLRSRIYDPEVPFA